MKGVLTLQDVAGKRTTMALTGLDPAATGMLVKLKTFAASIQPYLNAAIIEAKLLKRTTEAVLGQVATSNEYVSGMHKAFVNFFYSEDGEQKPLNLWIPAPEMVNFELVEDVGYRMTVAAGHTLQAGLRTATGLTDLTFSRGIVEYRNGKSTRPSETPYIKLVDANNRVQYMSVPAVTDLAKLKTFATSVLRGSPAFTNAAVIEVGVTVPEYEALTNTPQTEAHYDSIEQRATLKFEYAEGTTKKFMQLSFPAMYANAFGARNDEKIPVKRAIGELIANSITTFYGSGVRKAAFVNGERDAVKLA
jgi:hypothetical protein